MYCHQCGSMTGQDAKFCTSCGARQTIGNPDGAVKARGLAGFSNRITDPAFARHIKNSNRWSAIFSVILAAAAFIGFTVAGELGVEDMENPQSLFIGIGIGGMFLSIALFQIIGRKRSRTWEGTVVDKTSKKKERRLGSDDDSYTDYYMEYVVTVQEDGGKRHRLVTEDDTTVYDYYKVGDRVKHHGGLNSYEKFDKSGDSIIFCAACASLNSIEEEYCARCKCPLLK